GPNVMFLPVVSSEDGYGLTYGAQFAVPDPIGKNSRLAFPATWGGDKRAGAEVEKDFDRGAVSRLSAGASISRRTNPFYDRDDDRGRLWVRAERELAHPLRLGATLGWQHALFLDASDSFTHAGADLVLDTRLDPMLARNAVYARAAWERDIFRTDASVNRSELEGRGYVGLLGQTVLVVRGLRDDSDGPLPAYLKPILGGMANVRGFRAGTAVGDTLMAGSAALRIPLTSPLDIGKIGASAFV